MTFRSPIRSIIYQTEKIFQRLRFANNSMPQNGWPILSSISFPNSCPHLLDQILPGFSKVALFSLRLHSFYAEYKGKADSSMRLNKPLIGWILFVRTPQTRLKSFGLEKLLESDAVKVILDGVLKGGDFLLKE